MKKSYIKIVGSVFLLILLLVITFIYAMFQGGFVSWFIFYSFLPFGLYSLLVCFYPLSMFEVSRKVEKEQFTAGEKFKATITIERKLSFFPLLFVIVEEEVPVTLKYSKQSKRTKNLVFPWFNRTIEIEYIIESIPRGEHLFKTIRIKTGDLFGLIDKERSFEVKKAYLVYPQYVDLIYRQLENRFDQGNTSSRTKLVRDTTMAVGVREYQPGDRFTWIDWKSSARKNTFMTKEFEQQQSHDVIVFMDRSKDQDPTMFEQVVILSASIVRSIIRNGAQMGIISVGKERFISGINNNKEHQKKIFYHLAKVQRDGRSFAAIVDSELSKWEQGLTMLFVTSDLPDSFIRTIERMIHRRYNLILFVVLPKKSPSKEVIMKIEKLKSKQIFVKAVMEGQYADAFHEVSR